MSPNNIILPAKPRILRDEPTYGIFEVDGLFPGYGHTLGNSLRRVILSSIHGVAATSIKIDGVKHEFSTIEGVKEDVISIILNLKRTKFKMHVDEPVEVSLNVKGPKKVTSGMIKVPSQAELINDDVYLFEITTNAEVNLTLTIEKGLGFVPREMLPKNKADIGVILLDAAFTPVRRVSYEVENMRVGDRTDHNKLRISIETDGTVSAKEVFEMAIRTMINQLQSIVGYREFSIEEEIATPSITESANDTVEAEESDISKKKIEDIGLSTRTLNTLLAAGIKTVGGLTKKSEQSVSEIEGMGAKGMEEINETLALIGLKLK